MLATVWVSGDEGELSAVRALFQEYQRELDIDLCFQGFDDELRSLPGKYAPPSGALLLMREADDYVACGAMRDLGDGVCELKRLYVKPGHRGKGLGERITGVLMSRARELGYRTVRLDTLRRLAPALRLYDRLGFREIPPYNFNPEPDIVYLERSL